MTRALIPFDPREACGLKDAARIANASQTTIRRWVAQHGIGRRVGGRMLISRPALKMMLEGDTPTLHRYVRGDRDHPSIASYFVRTNLAGVHASMLAENAAAATCAKLAERA